MFHARKPTSDRSAPILAVLLLLACWGVALATALPAAHRPARAHLVLQVRP